MLFFKKYHKVLFFLWLFNILIGCKLQESSKSHGIVFLENRSEILKINSTNKNDVIKIIGQPHSKSINNNNQWIYIERVLTKGEYYKLGQNILKKNNILILNFDRYGILTSKKLLNKDSKEKITFSQNKTENTLTQKSFVESFLSSVKSKMYGQKK